MEPAGKSIEPENDAKFPSLQPRDLTLLRRAIESNDYKEVERLIWSNPRYLVTVCDSAVYLMAGPKYNACHIAARANRPEMIALILETVSNTKFLRLLYPKEPDILDRLKHLLDSYLNTPDPVQGNTPLHFACKLGHYRVARILLTYEGCDLTLRDRQGKTAEESINNTEDQKLKDLFKKNLQTPYHRDRLKKLLMVERRNSRDSSVNDADTTADSLQALSLS